MTAILIPGVDTRADEYPTRVILPGNWADPSVVRVGDTYYLTANNDHHVPSVTIFASKDLRYWQPMLHASPDEGQGPATELVTHDGKLYVYGGGGDGAWVMVSEPPFTAWSERINMEPIEPHGIDPGHIADDEGRRYLYTNQGKALQLSPNGLKAATAPEKVYEAWPIPERFAIECECLESPKLFKRGGWYYMVSAQGGTAGPATSHMAVVARSRHVLGPWEDAPDSPLICTESPFESWWSKGHATLIEGPKGDWFAIYHGYPGNQRSFGRSTLISPVEWRDDGWPQIATEWPVGWESGKIGFNWPLSDDFEKTELGMQWQSLGELDRSRYHPGSGSLLVDGLGSDPAESHPLTVNPRHLAYEVETEVSLNGAHEAGLVLYYSPRAYMALSVNRDGELTKQARGAAGATLTGSVKLADVGIDSVRLKIRNDNQNVSFFHASGDSAWRKVERSFDISGYQHNIFGGFVSVRPGIFVTGEGKAEFDFFRYCELK